MLTVVPDVAGALPAGEPSSLIDQIVRDGARQMLAAALQAEVAAYIGQFAGLRDEDGRRMVVRNGTAGPRTVLTSAGAVEVTAPRVNDKRTDPASGERMRFSSAILPPWARKTPQVSEVLPLLYLHGLSSGDFVLALGQFLGSPAGLSASTVTRLTETWSAEAASLMTRDLSQADYVYLWVDGIHLGIRLGEGKLCLLVMIGVRADGRKELVAFYDYPAERWVHLRTINPIESTFATVRLRTKVTKGHGSKAAALAMAFRLIESAQRRWRMVNAPHLVALVRAGSVFVNGKLVERPGDDTAQEAQPEAA
jgi:transposase-like protein